MLGDVGDLRKDAGFPGRTVSRRPTHRLARERQCVRVSSGANARMHALAAAYTLRSTHRARARSVEMVAVEVRSLVLGALARRQIAGCAGLTPDFRHRRRPSGGALVV
jgi:hypothetical protein